MDEKKETKNEGYKLVEVPTEYGTAIEREDGEQISQTQLLVEVANEIKSLRKELTGK